jgi:hypothetical protein
MENNKNSEVPYGYYWFLDGVEVISAVTSFYQVDLIRYDVTRDALLYTVALYTFFSS